MPARSSPGARRPAFHAELPAARPDVRSTRIPPHHGDPEPSDSSAEGVHSLGRAGRERVVVADAVVGDEADAGGDPGAFGEAPRQIRKRFDMRVAVVDPGEQRVGEHRGDSGRLGVRGRDLQHLRQRVRAFQRDEPSSLVRNRGSDRDAQANVGQLFHQGAQATEVSGRADGDGPSVDGEQARVAHHADRTDDLTDVRERFAHALEDHTVHACAVGQVIAELAHLVDDLPCVEVTRQAHASGGAEGAADGAADLRRDACDESSGPFEGDAHGLDDGAVGATEGILDERVEAARASLDDGQRGDDEGGPDLKVGAATDSGRRDGRELALPVHKREDASGFGEGQAWRVLDELVGQGGEQGREGHGGR
jgi:hypothetical protein